VNVPIVQPVEIDVVRLQTPQRLLAGTDNRLTAGTPAVWIAGV
jgi:hypothetical protein